MGKIKGQSTTADYLPMGDFLRLIEGLHKDKQYMWELHACISFSTGLRGSDVLSLKWKDILCSDMLNKIEQKTGKTRQIPLNKEVRKKISGLYDLMDKPDKQEYIFHSPQRSQAYSLKHVNLKLKTFRVHYRLPIKAMSTHTYRKTFGRYVYESLSDKSEALILLNSLFKHTSLEVTKRYIGIEQDQKKKVYAGIRF